MKSWNLGMLATALAVVATGGYALGTLPGEAAPKKPGETEVGYVDLARVTEQIRKSPNWVTLTKQYDDSRAKFENEIRELTATRYLKATERQELQSLKAKPNVSPKEKERIAELESKSDTLEREFQMLATVEKPSAEQSNRIKELQKMREDALNQVQVEIEKRQAELNRLQGDVLDGMQKRILENVGKVSDSKNITLVLDRQAILYGGQDITEDVLKKLGADVK